ncbi:MAG: methyl-accepting chemotaxis protein [Thermodesulfobacteriota bacterium]
MRNSKISVKLIGGFIIVVLTVLIIGFTGWRGVSQTNNALEEVNNIHLPGILALGIIKEAQTAVMKSVHSLLIMEFLIDRNEMNYQIKSLEEAWKRVEEGVTIYDTLPKTKEEVEIWKDLKLTWERLKENTKQITEFSKSGSRDPAIRLVTGKGRDAFVICDRFIADLISLKRKIAGEVEKRSKAQADRARMISLVGMIVGTLIALGLGIFLSRSITKPISRLVSATHLVAQGNFTGSLSVVKRNDEIGLLSESFSSMYENLKNILGKTQEAVTHITSASAEILAAAQQQSAGAREQSSAINETASATTELAKSAEQVGENIKRVAQVANQVLVGMTKLKEGIGITEAKVNSLGERSQQIGKITELINDVADQTNLLAVNAAIEAARAGEEGRGFTVVADEIRKLADSTAKSTKDITSLIEIIQHDISNIIIAVEGADKLVTDEIKLTQESTESAKEIAMSATQQVASSKQIADAMFNINEAMRQITTGAQQAQAAAQQLNGLAKELKDITEKFIIR